MLLSYPTNLWIIVLICSIGLSFSALIPPFQSPDEFDHIKRTYLLSQGTIVMDAPDGQPSGGMIDAGLIAYMVPYQLLPFHATQKLSSVAINSVNTIQWSGHKIFSPAPGVAYYFPFIYMPQAIGLAIGKKYGLTIDTSYRLARLLALASIAILLVIAFNIYPVNPLTLALLILPMTLFQCSSASLDGITAALAIFCIAIFFRIATDKQNSSPWLFYGLTLSVVLLATSRVHLLPLLILTFAACCYLKKNKCFFFFALSVLGTLIWLAIAIKTTVDNRVVTGAASSTIALFYVKNPLLFLKLILIALSEHMKNYRESFLGILGWLDTPFSLLKYRVLSVSTLSIGLLSISFKHLCNEWIPRSIVFFSALLIFLLVFFALLITWNTHPATSIQGVQGRYFLVPALMLAYAFSGELKKEQTVCQKAALLLTIFLGLFTISSTTELLIKRYYLIENIPTGPVR